MTMANDSVLCIGRNALLETRRALLRDLGERGSERMQEIGCSAGEEFYNAFCNWLPGYAGVDTPDDLSGQQPHPIRVGLKCIPHHTIGAASAKTFSVRLLGMKRS